MNAASQKRSGGKFAAVVGMGALSALVVGACMTAPLFAVLAFIAHTGNAVLGGAALFSMGVGLGVPLLDHRTWRRHRCCRAPARGWTA